MSSLSNMPPLGGSKLGSLAGAPPLAGQGGSKGKYVTRHIETDQLSTKAICDLLQQNPEQVAWDYFEI